MTHLIHKAMNDAMKEIARIGIGKTSTASLGGAPVKYRGIEAAMNEMSGVLIRNGITVTPRYSSMTIAERVKGDPKDGKATRFATVLGSFTFASVEDGSSVLCECYGEAMDSGDKAVTKAQSVAFRTALFQQFVVPTMAIDPEADAQPEDGDATPLPPNVFDDLIIAISEAASMGALKKTWDKAMQLAQSAGDGTAYKEFKDAVNKRKAELGESS